MDVQEGTDVGMVRLVAVLPQHQRQGVGRSMMRAIEAIALANGLRRLDVHAAPDAVAFYKKTGWKVIDPERRNPLMTKALF